MVARGAGHKPNTLLPKAKKHPVSSRLLPPDIPPNRPSRPAAPAPRVAPRAPLPAPLPSSPRPASTKRTPRGFFGRLWAAVCWVMPPWGELMARPSRFAWVTLSVVLLALCFPPLSLWPVAFVALVPWLWALRGTTERGALWVSLVFGFLHFLTMFYWLGALARFNPFIYLGIPLLCLYHALYVAAAGAGMVAAARRSPPWVALVVGAGWWAGLEWWRSVGPLGSPFALLGHAIRDFTPLVQVVSLGGVPLLGALVLMVNLALMETVATWRRGLLEFGTIARLATAIGLVAGATTWGWGVVRDLDATADDSIALSVALIQPNVPQDVKFDSYASTEPERVRELQDAMTRDVFALIDEIEPGSVDLVVTPESAFTDFFFDLDTGVQDELRRRAHDLDAPILAGAVDVAFVREDGSFTNDHREAAIDASGNIPYEAWVAIYLFRPDDTTQRQDADYRKIHLMPFGESVPYFDLIPGLQEHIVQVGTFLRGSRWQPPMYIPVHESKDSPRDQVTQVQLGPTICYEDMFAGLNNRLAYRGAQVLVNVTNNAWFDPTLGGVFHTQFARLRSPETRLPQLLVTNTGPTAVVDAAGRIVDTMPRFERGVKVVTVQVPRTPTGTWYARLGDWFGMLGFFGGLAMLVALARQRDEE